MYLLSVEKYATLDLRKGLCSSKRRLIFWRGRSRGSAPCVMSWLRPQVETGLLARHWAY